MMETNEIDISCSASIEDVKTGSTFIWHNQRYKLIREYYEKPIFAYPPLSLLAYIGFIIMLIRKKQDKDIFRKLSKSFDKLPKNKQTVKFHFFYLINLQNWTEQMIMKNCSPISRMRLRTNTHVQLSMKSIDNL